MNEKIITLKNLKILTKEFINKLSGKADKSDIPTSLPANGGNADTVGGKSAEELTQSNPNLLDNPDFRINQRDVTSITGNAYGADRWCGDHSVDDTGVWIKSINVDSIDYFFRQYIEPARLQNFNGTPMTLSFSNNGTVYSGTAIINISDITSTQSQKICEFMTSPWNIGLFAITNKIFLRITNYTDEMQHIEWMKLEPGSVATPFVPPDPCLELLKCRRYFEKKTAHNVYAIKSNAVNWSTTIQFADKRVMPSINITKIYANETDVDHSEISPINVTPNSASFYTTGNNQIGFPQYGDFAFTIECDISADL